MNGNKSFLRSLGIMGPLIGLIVFAANYFKPGLGLTEADVAPVIDAIDTIWIAATAIVGRWRATIPVSLTGPVTKQ